MVDEVLSNDPLIGDREAAQLLTIQPATLAIWRATKRYNLPYVKIGRSVRYRKSAVLAFIESRTVAA